MGNKLHEFLQKIPYSSLIIGGVLMGLAPFFPIPHTIEKAQMLLRGELTKPLDIFDLLFHLFPLLLLGLKYGIANSKKNYNTSID
jgi:hypothetical protein